MFQEILSFRSSRKKAAKYLINHEVTISNFTAGNYQFSFNRGNSETIECNENGIPVISRSVRLRCDTTLYYTISAWADDYFNNAALSNEELFEATMARAAYYAAINLDSSYVYATRLYSLAQKLHSPAKEAQALNMQGLVFSLQGNGEKALELLYKSLQLKKLLNDSSGAAATYYNIGKLYEDLQDLIKAKNNYQKSVEWTTVALAHMQSPPLTKIGNLFLNEDKKDSALKYAVNALQLD